MHTYAKLVDVYRYAWESSRADLFEVVGRVVRGSFAQICGDSDLCLKSTHKFCRVLRKFAENSNKFQNHKQQMQNKKQQQKTTHSKFSAHDNSKLSGPREAWAARQCGGRTPGGAFRTRLGPRADCSRLPTGLSSKVPDPKVPSVFF